MLPRTLTMPACLPGRLLPPPGLYNSPSMGGRVTGASTPTSTTESEVLSELMKEIGRLKSELGQQ